jgi:large-conductance mechanosensitive channel
MKEIGGSADELKDSLSKRRVIGFCLQVIIGRVKGKIVTEI